MARRAIEELSRFWVSRSKVLRSGVLHSEVSPRSARTSATTGYEDGDLGNSFGTVPLSSAWAAAKIQSGI
jgi:hypothetical protein